MKTTLHEQIYFYSVKEFADQWPQKFEYYFSAQKSDDQISVLVVKKNTRFDEPINLSCECATLYVIVEDGADIIFISQKNDVPTNLKFFIEKNACVDYILNSYIEQMSISAHVGSSSQLIVVPLLKDSIQLAIELNLNEQYARGYIVGNYALQAQQKITIDTMQKHSARHTTSRLFLNGVIADNAHALYQGTINIEKQAEYSDAAQSNKNMLFGHNARAVSVPNLEVKTNEVKCKHGSAVGCVGAEQLFYMQARGLQKEVAQKLLLKSFSNEVFKELPEDSKKKLAKYIQDTV